MVAVTAKRLEIDLVQNDRLHCKQLFPLEPIDLGRRRAGSVQGCEARPNGIQLSDCAAVMVYVMAYEQPL